VEAGIGCCCWPDCWLLLYMAEMARLPALLLVGLDVWGTAEPVTEGDILLSLERMGSSRVDDWSPAGTW
jgi:hypothetical protein